MCSKITGDDLKQIIYQALAPEPLLVEPVSNEDPPEVMSESVEDKLFSVLKQMKPEQRMSLFARFGFVLKNKVSKELTNNILTNLSSISKASKGKYPS
mgnify:CR=1 FL=1|tara:strand:+ start:1645 stop:1938 length:294 start_codon:yes stop_codon:yes gene_type:complete